MIARRVVAGPSPVLLAQRHMSSLAFAIQASARADDEPASLPPRPSPPLPSPIAYSDSGRIPLPTPRLTTSPHDITRLHDCASITPTTYETRKATWGIYNSLSPSQRAGLPSSLLRVVLGTVVPKYDDAWKVVQKGTNRTRADINRKLGYEWERKLRAIMSDLVSNKDASLDEWFIVLHSFMRVGYVSACESVVNEIQPHHRHHLSVIEVRLGTIVRWLRNLRDSGARPDSSELEIAHTAFWEVFRDIQDNQLELSGFTLRLLLEVSSEFTNAILELDANDSVARFDEVLRYVFLNGYGLDLDSLPQSVEQRAFDKSGTYPILSANALNAALSQLRRRGTDVVRLLTMFELLTTRTKVPSTVANARQFDDDEDEEFIPTLTNQTAAEEASGERRNWLGMRVPKTEFFNASTSSAPASPDTTSSSSAVEDNAAPDAAYITEIRHVSHYLQRPPISPIAVTPAPSFTPPAKMTWNAKTINILLLAAGQGEKRFPDYNETDRLSLMAILELCVNEAMTYNATWLSQYLACPKESRRRLKRPQAINPEWFRYTLARQTETYGRDAYRVHALLKDTLQWTQQMIEVIIARETTLAGEPLPIVDGQVRMRWPTYMGSPKHARKWRTTEVFLASDELENLYLNAERLQDQLQRAETVDKLRRERRDRSSLERRAHATEESGTS